MPNRRPVDQLLDDMDDVITDWNGSRDSMHATFDHYSEQKRQEEDLYLRLADRIAFDSGIDRTDAMAAVQDIAEHGPASVRLAALLPTARTFEPCAKALDHAGPGLELEALRQMLPSLVPALVQMVSADGR